MVLTPVLIARWVLLACLWIAGGVQAGPVVRIGVLSFMNKADTLAQWEPTARQLEASLIGTRFHIIPQNYDELNASVKAGDIDFVLTNPEHYVVLRNVFRVSPMVTLNTLIDNQVFDRFGSVIFTRASARDIQDLSDVRGKSVAAVGLYSLGGFLMAADRFLDEKIDLRSNDVRQLKFVGLPHSLVVPEVLSGRADVGIVRTGVLEQMALQGKLDRSQLRVLHAQPLSRFPQAHSTALYPEWPWASLPGTPAILSKSVTLALLQIAPQSAAALAGRYHGFSPPANYAPVEELMRRLDVYPGVEAKPLWLELWLKHSVQIQFAALFLLVAGFGMSAHLWRSNRRLREMTRLYQQAQSSLQVTAAAFNSQVGLIVTDDQTRIVRANQAFCDMLGYTEDFLLGQTTLQLRGQSVTSGTVAQLWTALQTTGGWQGEMTCRHRSGHDLPCLLTITAIRSDLTGLSGYVSSFVDISHQKKTESEIRQLAFFDTLTDLPNRRLFLQQLQTAVTTSLENNSLGALMFIDLDHFKMLNDTHGHSVGDQLLQLIARRLTLLLGPQALAARLGGDEFVVMLTDLTPDESIAMGRAMALAHQIHQSILAPYQLSPQGELGETEPTLRYNCSGSIGVTLFGLQDERVTEVLKRADLAMYQSKQGGRNTICQFDPAGQQAMNAKVALINDLSTALTDGEFVLHYQVQTNARGDPVGAECLLRWHHPVRGQVSPVEFIPLAEESGAILAIGEWVLRTACETLAGWAADPGRCHLSLSVNVSPRQFIEADFVPRLEKILAQTGARPTSLVLEITEGIILQNTAQVIEKMHLLCGMGLTFSIDDFGTGYSSLSYLQKLPLHEVKIDKAFVRDLTYNKNSEAIVRAIIALGTSMNITVVSEGVETEAQNDQLIAMGCTLLQGYLIARPMTLAALEEVLQDTVQPMRAPVSVNP